MSGTIYIGATVATSTPPGSYKTLPGLGFYTFLYPHLYYVSQETQTSGQMPRPFYNTWFSEGCTPANARVAASTPASAPVVAELLHTATLSCVPNPVHTNGRIQFSLSSDTDAQVELFTLIGSRISILPRQSVSQGDHTLELPQNLANGVYMIRLTTPAESRFTRVVVQR